MIFEIELFFPTAAPGSGAKTESLGACRIITEPLFLTVTEHNDEAHLVAVADLREIDRNAKTYTTTLGRTHHPRRMDLPGKIYVETQSGHARSVNGDLIARMVRSARDSGSGRISW